MEITLEMIDAVRERSGASYEDAVIFSSGKVARIAFCKTCNSQ